MVRLILAVTYAMLTSAAFAGGTHEGPEPMRVGEAGSIANVTQTIQVTMKETDDGKMLFTPATMQFRKGQTVKLRIKNIGELDHEFVLDEQAKNTEHRAVMEKFPEMEHDNPNAIRLAPGESGEIVWKFTNGGSFEFACLVPGHYDAGMHGALNVAAK